ncbi:MAG TPA: chorismate synthase, partial [Bacillota bacterium]|nr:chorismate synthase [Bacillota bacterium]
MMRYLSAGESHGRCLVAIIEGLPAGLEISAAAINRHLARRQQGYGRGGRMAIEKDRVEFLAGLRFNRTLGSPLALQIINRDWDNWCQIRAPEEEHPPRAVAVSRRRP